MPPTGSDLNAQLLVENILQEPLGWPALILAVVAAVAIESEFISGSPISADRADSFGRMPQGVCTVTCRHPYSSAWYRWRRELDSLWKVIGFLCVLALAPRMRIHHLTY